MTAQSAAAHRMPLIDTCSFRHRRTSASVSCFEKTQCSHCEYQQDPRGLGQPGPREPMLVPPQPNQPAQQSRPLQERACLAGAGDGDERQRRRRLRRDAARDRLVLGEELVRERNRRHTVGDRVVRHHHQVGAPLCTGAEHGDARQQAARRRHGCLQLPPDLLAPREFGPVEIPDLEWNRCGPGLGVVAPALVRSEHDRRPQLGVSCLQARQGRLEDVRFDASVEPEQHRHPACAVEPIVDPAHQVLDRAQDQGPVGSARLRRQRGRWRVHSEICSAACEGDSTGRLAAPISARVSRYRRMIIVDTMSRAAGTRLKSMPSRSIVSAD